jgi:gliding motility-associated-like protein
MNKFKDISEFEHLLKSNLQKHSSPTPPDVWINVAASTAPSVGVLGQAMSFLSSTTNLLKLALFVGGIAAVGIVIYNENNATSGNVSRTTRIPEQSDAIKTMTPEVIDSLAQTTNTERFTDQSGTQPKDPNYSAIKKKNTENILQTDKLISELPIVSESSQSTDKFEAVLPTNKIAATIHSQFKISNTKPCVGETVSLTQAKPTNWYVNGVKVAQNTATHVLKTPEAGIVFVSNGEQTKSIDVSSQTAHITTQEIGPGKFRCELEDGLIGNWHLDEKLVFTNASVVDLEILNVGTHTLKSTVVNHACNATVTKNITIDPLGSIVFYEIFTPDGDGVNDFYSVDIVGYENFSIQIFDNNNRRVFLSQTPDNKWNGKLNNEGSICKNGSYYVKISYKLKGENPQVKSIKLFLKR